MVLGCPYEQLMDRILDILQRVVDEKTPPFERKFCVFDALYHVECARLVKELSDSQRRTIEQEPFAQVNQAFYTEGLRHYADTQETRSLDDWGEIFHHMRFACKHLGEEVEQRKNAKRKHAEDVEPWANTVDGD